jgi:chorismate mutase
MDRGPHCKQSLCCSGDCRIITGVDIPVLVKNPLNPDVDLWYGAINRFIKVGLKEVGAIHRGFSIWGESIYRNPPIWKIPNDLKQQNARYSDDL